MVFNEYVDILNEGEAFFVDEGNLYQLMMEEDKAQQPKLPSNSLSGSDSTASPNEPESTQDSDPKKGLGEKAKDSAKSILGFFTKQASVFREFSQQQMGKMKARIQEITKKTNDLPQTIDENNDEEVEEITGGVESAPRLNRSNLNDPQKAEAELAKYKSATEAYNERMDKKTKKKGIVKGMQKLFIAKFLFNQVKKVSADVEINLKEGTFAIGVGSRAAQQGVSGNGFFGSLAKVLKNVFLAILVLIGGVFKVLKIYLGAIGRIFASIFGTIGAAGKTLVTGQMPGKQ